MPQSPHEVLAEHDRLGPPLARIPHTRQMICRQEGDLFKPRFVPALYTWESGLRADLETHLEQIYQCMRSCAHYVEPAIWELVSKQYFGFKGAIVFLLERDVWETNEVFGEYLVEGEGTEWAISYSRRGQRRFTVHWDGPAEALPEFIQEDARKQVVAEFWRRWHLLREELDVICRIDDNLAPTEYTYFSGELGRVQTLAQSSPTAALMELGRLHEWWLLELLGIRRAPARESTLELVKRAGLLDTQDIPTLKRIRRLYNDLKHVRGQVVDRETVEDLIQRFGAFISSPAARASAGSIEQILIDEE